LLADRNTNTWLQKFLNCFCGNDFFACQLWFWWSPTLLQFLINFGVKTLNVFCQISAVIPLKKLCTYFYKYTYVCKYYTYLDFMSALHTILFYHTLAFICFNLVLEVLSINVCFWSRHFSLHILTLSLKLFKPSCVLACNRSAIQIKEEGKRRKAPMPHSVFARNLMSQSMFQQKEKREQSFSRYELITLICIPTHIVARSLF